MFSYQICSKKQTLIYLCQHVFMIFSCRLVYHRVIMKCYIWIDQRATTMDNNLHCPQNFPILLWKLHPIFLFLELGSVFRWGRSTSWTGRWIAPAIVPLKQSSFQKTLMTALFSLDIIFWPALQLFFCFLIILSEDDIWNKRKVPC